MGGVAVLVCLSVLLCPLALAPATHALGFSCTSQPEATCQALVGYKSPNTTTLKSIQSLFGVKHLRSLLAANNLSPTAPRTTTVQAQDIVKIPITCRCSNGSGISDPGPVYTVQKDDGLYYIASIVFSYLVVYPDIQLVNNIENADLIDIGQKLRIPLPCSCDQLGGQRAVHYAHVVAEGSSVKEIAREFGAPEQTLLDLNRLASPNDLMADTAFDVPLKACTSKIRNESLDASLLVPNDSYAFTAKDCVQCSCDSANDWILQCQPSKIAAASSDWTCPSMRCSGANNLSIGNTTLTSCSVATCSYAGYTSQNILTSLDTNSTCPGPLPSPGDNGNSHAAKMAAFGWSFLATAMSILLSMRRI